MFNYVEQVADEAEADALTAAESDHESDGKSKKPRPKRKGLNPDITRVQQRSLLTDEQRECAVRDRYLLCHRERGAGHNACENTSH